MIVAIPSYLNIQLNDWVVIDEHAYFINGITVASQSAYIPNSVLGPYNSCEDAISNAVSTYGSTSGCRYTFSACCSSNSITYTNPFSIQGISALTGNHILTSPLSLIDTNTNYANTCVSLFDYNESVTIDNSKLTPFDIVSDEDNCGDGRCSRCAVYVSPCSDASKIILWIYTPQSGIDYSVGQVIYGSNIDGYITNTNYTVNGSCVTIVNASFPNSGVMYTVDDISNTSPDYGTNTSESNCDSLDCCECREDVRVRNSYADGTTSITYTWTNCNGTSGSYVLNSVSGVSTTYTIPNCIEYSTLSRTPNNSFGGVINIGTCCY
jgi:hypothetical protein